MASKFFTPILAKFQNLKQDLLASLPSSPAPDQRTYEICYFPLVTKHSDGRLVYLGAFVPDLYELARANNSATPFEAAILLPEQIYEVSQTDGTFVKGEDLSQVAHQVNNKMFDLAQTARKNKQNINIYTVDRMPAADLYLKASNIVFLPAVLSDTYTVKDLAIHSLINPYGGGRKTHYTPTIQKTEREKRLHLVLSWMARAVAAITAIGTGLAFLPAAPYLGLLAAIGTYYVIASVQIFEFWDKAETLIRHNWALSWNNLKAKQIDKIKLAKTLVIAAIVLFLTIEGAMGAYTGMISVLSQIPYFAAMITAVPKALLGLKACVGILSTIGALSAFRGLMNVMHNFMGLGYAKTTITPEEIAALPIEAMLAKKPSNNPEVEVAALNAELKKAQNPCVSKVVTLEAVFKDLQANGEIAQNVDFEDAPAFDKAFRLVTQNLPMNLGAWAPAQVFDSLSQAQKMQAIEHFKQNQQRLAEYQTSPEYQAYLTSARYDLDKNAFKAYLKGETYKLRPEAEVAPEAEHAASPLRDCCAPLVFSRSPSRERELEVIVAMPLESSAANEAEASVQQQPGKRRQRGEF